MSGIVALAFANNNCTESTPWIENPGAGRGTVPDADIAESLLQSLAFRGPDAQNSIACGPAWLGHALLRTDEPKSDAQQPCSLDGITWITADIRLDGCDELVHELESSSSLGRADLIHASDAQLVLHAYRAWGLQCVEHLTGDFAFAIWDSDQRALFCARDQLGIKPLYHADLGNGLAVSNTLQTLLQAPSVSEELNEVAIGDFLMFGFNQSRETTFFRDVHRVPPAHGLWWQAGKLRLWPFFEFAEGLGGNARDKQPLRFRRREDCIEEFRSRFQQAVHDRLRNGRASILMSGGLDSTSVAATAVEIFSASDQMPDLKAFTATYEKTCGDREAEFASLTAGALHIPLELLSGDGYVLFARTDQPDAGRPEPLDEPLAAFDEDFHRAAAAHSRVALAGEGGDIGLHPQAGPYLLWLLKRFQLVRGASEIAASVRLAGRLPPLLLDLRSRGKHPSAMELPKWIDPSFANRCGLRGRWDQLSLPTRGNHPLRPMAYAALEGNFWPSLFESADPGATGILMETRLPFLDLRLLSWLLSLPPVPWCLDKYLLREAMRGRLPEAVRLRPKTPLSANPAVILAREQGVSFTGQGQFAGEIRRYVASPEFFAIEEGDNQDTMLMKFRAVILNSWLQNRGQLKYKKALGGII